MFYTACSLVGPILAASTKARHRIPRIAIPPEVVGERAATLLVPNQDDLDAVTRQKIDGGPVDARRQHLLRAALQQRHTAAPDALGPENLAAGRAPRSSFQTPAFIPRTVSSATRAGKRPCRLPASAMAAASLVRKRPRQ